MRLTNVAARAYTGGHTRRFIAKAAARAGLLGKEAPYRLALVDRPEFAYGVLAAAAEAAKLGYPAITAIEFGVGARNGLIMMERHAETVTAMTGIDIHVVGFDTGTGLPAPVDYRDLPYVWDAGFYKMDEGLLRSRLRNASLVIGDVRQTAGEFIASAHPPIGFVSFDLDYWSSTVAAFDIFRGDPRACMPRAWCYFDDATLTIEDVGELRAIRDFNDEAHGRRIRRQHGLRDAIPFHPSCVEDVFQAHLFDHPHYGRLLADRDAERVALHR